MQYKIENTGSKTKGSSNNTGTFFQPKLRIGPAYDQFEQEADKIAEQVVSPETQSEQFFKPTAPVSGRVQRMCAACTKEEEEKGKIQRKEAGSNGEQSYAPPIVSEALNSGGNPMDRNSRNFMESRFGYDFSHVKIHTDEVAARSAESVNALAYTSGNDIVFNKGQYSTGSESGKRLLAHELTHVVQQSSAISAGNKIQRTCNLNFSTYTGPSCEGTIEVGATTISPSIVGYYHLFVLYTDNIGRKFFLRGGPENPSSGGYGKIITLCAPYVQGQIEYDPRNVIEQVYQGTDACNKLRTMQVRLNEIEGWNIPYVPAGPNSNSVVATLLRATGLPHRKPALPTPGFNMEVTASGSAPLTQERPTIVLISLGGGQGLLLSTELQQRLFTFTPVTGGGIPIPIPLELNAGLYSIPDQGRTGGSVGVSTDISLINLPLSVFSPLGIVVGGGFTAGAARTTDAAGATRTDPEIGGYARAGLYTDINRFRISPMYQYNAFHNTATGATTSAHSFIVQLGYTF